MYESLASRAQSLHQRILAIGWGPIDQSTGSPNYRVKWYPEASAHAGTLDPEEAVDAANLAVETLRDVFRVDDPRDLNISSDHGEVIPFEADGVLDGAPAMDGAPSDGLGLSYFSTADPLTLAERRALAVAVDFDLEQAGVSVRSKWKEGGFTNRLVAVSEAVQVTYKTPHGVMKERLLTSADLQLGVSEKVWLANCADTLIGSDPASDLFPDLYCARAKLLA
jgi:hypothetical protein